MYTIHVYMTCTCTFLVSVRTGSGLLDCLEVGVVSLGMGVAISGSLSESLPSLLSTRLLILSLLSAMAAYSLPRYLSTES